MNYSKSRFSVPGALIAIAAIVSCTPPEALDHLSFAPEDLSSALGGNPMLSFSVQTGRPHEHDYAASTDLRAPSGEVLASDVTVEEATDGITAVRIIPSQPLANEWHELVVRARSGTTSSGHALGDDMHALRFAPHSEPVVAMVGVCQKQSGEVLVVRFSEPVGSAPAVEALAVFADAETSRRSCAWLGNTEAFQRSWSFDCGAFAGVSSIRIVVADIVMSETGVPLRTFGSGAAGFERTIDVASLDRIEGCRSWRP